MSGLKFAGILCIVYEMWHSTTSINAVTNGMSM